MATTNSSQLRSWARANGYDVGDRGRISQDVVDAFTAATGSTVTTAKKAAKKAAKRPAAKSAGRPAAKTAPRKAAAAGKAAGKSAARPAAVRTATAGSRTESAKDDGVKADLAATPQVVPALDEAKGTGPVGGPVTKTPSAGSAAQPSDLAALADTVRALEARVAGLERAAAAPKRRFGRRS